MNLLEFLLPCSRVLRLTRYELDREANHLSLQVSSTQTMAHCPLCGTSTERIHSHYERTLADLPCVDFSLTLLVQVSKFFCVNPECQRRIFTERLPELVAPWARKTARLVERMQQIGLALGGAAGARLGGRLGYFGCGSTLLNQLQRLPLPEFDLPKVLGVDDFAFCKGQNYGTILVDLDRHQPIALLPDRQAETLADWLRQHPGIDILARDRSKIYRRAITDGAPKAIQVADRFHLLQNLSETLECVLSGYAADLKAIQQALQQQVADSLPNTVVARPEPTPTLKAKQRALEAQQQRIEKQKTIKMLHRQGEPQTAIAQAVGLSIRTVKRYLNRPDFPDTRCRRSTFSQGILEPYKPQLLDWWNEGIHKPQDLMLLLQQQGYTGSRRTLQRYLKALRDAQGLATDPIKPDSPLPRVIDPQRPQLTPRRATYLVMMRLENRAPEDRMLLQRLAQHPQLAQVITLADEFLNLIRLHQAERLDDWLKRALNSPFKPFQSFATGLFNDYVAVKASLTTTVSNGAVEGLNNRLKMLKRQMYGRAGLDLLTKRFIMAA